MCSNSCSQTCTNAFTHANPNDKLEIPEKSLDTGWVLIYFILFILVNVMYRAVDGLLSESDGATSWTGGHDSSSYGSAKLDRQISTFLFSAASHIDSQSVNSLEFFDEEYELWFRRILMLKTLNVHRFTLVVTGFVLPFCFFTISASSSPNLLYSLIVLGITTVTLPLSKTSIYFSNELLFNDFLGTGVVVNAIGVLLNAFAGRFNGNAIHPFIVLAMVIFNAYLIMFMSGNVWVRKTLNLASMLFVYVVGTVFYRVPCYNKSSEASYPIVGVIPTLEYARFSFSCDPELDRLYMTIEVCVATAFVTVCVFVGRKLEKESRMYFFGNFTMSVERLEQHNKIEKMNAQLKAKELNPEQVEVVENIMKQNDESVGAAVNQGSRIKNRRRSSISSANALQQLFIARERIEILENSIGRGAFGEVHKGRYNGIFVAIKQLSKISSESKGDAYASFLGAVEQSEAVLGNSSRRSSKNQKNGEPLSAMQVMTCVAEHALRPTVSKQFPASVSALMQRCWSDRAKARPSFEEITEILNSVSRLEVLKHNKAEVQNAILLEKENEIAKKELITRARNE
ncbi:hypothetical protein ScalyP_jg9087, partial [Parmales sp. scaly parma]